ncbi:drug resistance transporter, EmrB/QacA subfamily [Fulvimarina manganoxydans]|uniref:Drug resistance transporter, EmrB/QacA subfamily n=1 Tax=Fulvimarina manganoxydans TaxID=937218 RepID=A0A1W2CGE4_9HYPH|nr:MFS transporter [Fulvimarina manganoxydans]SMC84136.1 drug resistance transporter, EmrB/QacA subfamily [Fulvimarina manganoxydans]
MQSADAQTPAAEVDPRRWITLAVLLTAGFMNLIDVTIVNVAIPSLKADFGATSSEIEWVVAGYIVAFALGLLPLGRLGDLVGRKRMFLMGVAGFTLCSALCGLSPTIDVLIAARLAQGFSAAMMMPQVLALVQVTFPDHERGFAFSLFGVTAGLASVAGPLAGGALISADLYDLVWRPIFLVNLPIGLLTILAGWRFIPNVSPSRRERIDVVGVLLGAATVFAIIIPLVEGREVGWPLWCFAMLAAALPLAIAFIVWERHRERIGATQLLPMSLIRNRHFLTGLAMTSSLFAGIPGFFFITAVFLQVGFGYSPLESGVATVPFPVGVFIASLVSGKFGSRAAKARLVAGPLILAAGMTILYAVVLSIGETVSQWSLVLPLFLCGLGMGITVAPLFATILRAVENRDAGSGSGALQSFQQIGGALGVAVSGEIFFRTVGETGAGAGIFREAFGASILFEIGVFLLLAFLSSRLPSGLGERDDRAHAKAPPAPPVEN